MRRVIEVRACLEPVSAAAQGACGSLVAGGVPEECTAVVLACPGLVPFVKAALDKLAELCACLPGVPCQLGVGRVHGLWCVLMQLDTITVMDPAHIDSDLSH